MIKYLVILLFLLAVPAVAQQPLDRASRPISIGLKPEPVHRAGICVQNMGQLAQEDSAYVRSGNSGWDYGCIWAQIDVGKPLGWFVDFLYAPSRMFVWEIKEPISRWSWRPSRHKEYVFTWVNFGIGYAVIVRPVAFRPSFGFVWPVQTGYHWGAPVGMNPYVGLNVSVDIGWFNVGVTGKVIYKRPHGWTVLEDWGNPEHVQPWTPHDWWIFPVDVRIGVTF